MIGRRDEIPRLQSDFYRDQYRKTLKYLFYCMILIYVLLAAIIYFTLSQPRQTYYANATNGMILPMPSHT